MHIIVSDSCAFRATDNAYSYADSQQMHTDRLCFIMY